MRLTSVIFRRSPVVEQESRQSTTVSKIGPGICWPHLPHEKLRARIRIRTVAESKIAARLAAEPTIVRSIKHVVPHRSGRAGVEATVVRASLHAHLENRGILGIREQRKSLFPLDTRIFGGHDTVEVTGSKSCRA
jgi:hypothetical protein